MPERWKHELKKLREFEPGAELGSRVAEGPRGEPSPPARQRAVTAVTALVVFAAAAIFAVRVFGTGSEGVVGTSGPIGSDGRLVIELSSGRGADQAPEATMRYGDREQHGVAEGYTWCSIDGSGAEQCEAGIADFAFYPPVGEFVVVPPGTPIEFTGDGTVESLDVTDPDGEPIPDAGSEAVPETDGRYVLKVNASWVLANGEHGDGNFFLGVQTLSSFSAAPDVLHVDCSAVVARTDTAVVRTQSDGLHVVFEGTDGFVEYGIVSPDGTSPDESVGVGGSLPVDGQGGVPVDPGSWEVGCGTRDRPVVEAGDLTAAFELVDPDDHWASFELGCDEPGEVSFTSSIPSSTAHEDTAAQLVGGLGGEDRLRGAGYGAEGYKLGIAYVVDRGGVSVARLVLTGGTQTWSGTFAACPESGIELTEAAASPSPAPEFPDVLVMRCEGLGPAIDADTVRLQPDGLHIEATNVADATVMAIDPQDGTVEAIVYPFETVTEEFVVDVPAGPLWIGCRVPNEQGEIEGGPQDVPDAYIQVTVLPAEG